MSVGKGSVVAFEIKPNWTRSHGLKNNMHSTGDGCFKQTKYHTQDGFG